MHCTYRVTYYYGRNICALLFSVGEGLLVSLCIRRPPIWDIMDILQGAWNPHQRVPFLKLCPPPKIHTYTQGIEKKKKTQNFKSRLVITPSQGGQTRTHSLFLGTYQAHAPCEAIHSGFTAHEYIIRPSANACFHPGLPLRIMDTICLLSTM